MAGWNKPNAANQPVKTPKKPSAMRGVVAGLVVVAIAGACIFLFMGKGEKPVEKNTVEKSGTIKEVVKPVAAPKADVSSKAAETKPEPEEKWDDSFVKIPEKRYKFSVLASVKTNEYGVINERWRMPNGKYWRRQIDPPPLFPNASDNAIAMAIGDRSGAPVPPYPGLNDVNLNQAFVESLLEPIVIKETDSAGIAALKLAVKETRDEIAKMIKAGDTRTVGEILQEHVAVNNHNAEMRAQTIRAYEQVRKEDGDEAAQVYLDNVNKALEKMGVPVVTIGKGRSNGQERSKGNEK